MSTDSSGNDFLETAIHNDHLRVTLVPTGWDGTRSVRLQMRDKAGHLRPGPEIPIHELGRAIALVIDISTK